MPRTAILAKSISLSRLSGLVARTVGVAPGRAFGHATATRLIVGVAAAQLGGTDSAPIEARVRNSANGAALMCPSLG
jgi:hypothetical protein